METINDITQDFGTLYHPKSALIFYETKGSNTDVYVEHFDMDSNGNPINAHPLTIPVVVDRPENLPDALQGLLNIE